MAIQRQFRRVSATVITKRLATPLLNRSLKTKLVKIFHRLMIEKLSLCRTNWTLTGSLMTLLSMSVSSKL